MANNYSLLLSTGQAQQVTVLPVDIEAVFTFLGQAAGQYEFTIDGQPPMYIQRQDIVSWQPTVVFQNTSPTAQLLDANVPFDAVYWGNLFVISYLAEPWIAADSPVMQAWFQKAYDRGYADAP